MLLMVTNRRIINGAYADEEKPHKKFEYQYAYNSSDDRFAMVGKKGFEIALFSQLNKLRQSGINTPKVGIYLHGFNNNYQQSIDELVDLENSLKEQLGYAPVIVGFSWPSTGKTAYYLSDREEARDSVGAFTRFLLEINALTDKNQQDCFSSVFCIAHSMGNYLLRKGMEYLSDSLGAPKGRKLFDETIMLAPDIASNDIEIGGKGSYIANFSRRVHVYYSKHDRALKASSAKRFGANRLGRHGANNYDNIQENVVIVNAKKYADKEAIKGVTDRSGKQVSVHSSHRYHKSILADIIQVMSSIDREQIQRREAVVKDTVEMKNHFKLI